MRIKKKLRIEKLELSQIKNEKYQLLLQDTVDWEVKSKFSLGEDELISGNINPNEKILGKDLVVILDSLKLEENKIGKNSLHIVDLKRVETAYWDYHTIPNSKLKKSRYVLRLKTPILGGIIAPVPSPYYDLKISLNEEEYQRVKRVSAGTIFEISYFLDPVEFKDIVVDYRCNLNSPRVFSLGYAGKIIPLIQEAIDYFEGDIDCLSHLSGIDIELEGSPADRKREQFGSRFWKRDYFLTESYGKDWVDRFKEDIDKVDKILRERYKNKLPMTPVKEFYDRIEICAYEAKKEHFIEEISVGLLAKYTFEKSYHLPSIEVETRSISGNLKACESVCKRLIEKTRKIFGLEKEAIHIQSEEYIR